MIKKFKMFEAHLRDRTEFKISGSIRNKEKLKRIQELSEWQNDNSISFLDLTNHRVKIEMIENRELDPNTDLIIIRPTTFELKKFSEVDIFKYKIFSIIGVPDDFPSKYALISTKDYMENKSYSTLNLAKLQRGDNVDEMVFMTLLSGKMNIPTHNGISFEQNDDQNRREQLEDYSEMKPDNLRKMESQCEIILKDFKGDFDVIYKDYSNFFVNLKAKELFYNNEEHKRRGYLFNKDKWNPADIWLIKGDMKDIEKQMSGFENLDELNSFLKQSIIDQNLPNRVVGISLKLGRQDSNLSLINMNGPEPYEHKYLGYTISPKGMNININYSWTKIEYDEDGRRVEFNNCTGENRYKCGEGFITIRNYTGGKSSKVSIEIKGDTRQDHMSGKMTSYLRPLFYDTDFFELQNEIVNSENENALYEIIGRFNLEEEIFDEFIIILNDDNPWDYKKMSKLQGLLIIDKMMKQDQGMDSIIHDMINYGRSQTEISAPHYVLK
jgi:hypothetical protein